MEQHQDEATHVPFPTNPEEFDSDDRISFSKLDNKFLLVQEDGTEFEFDNGLKRWVPILDEALLEEQQKAYKVEGVDDEVVDRKNKKRKNEYVNGEDEGGRTVKAPKNSKQPQPRANTAVYVTGLPLDVTVGEVHDVFSRKCGVIAEEVDSGRPRIKLYNDEQGRFKGDALVVFFKPQSVDMAIMLLDDTPFRIEDGQSSGNMRVQVADSSYKKVQHTEGEEEKDHKHKTSMRDKQKIIKRTQKLEGKLADWDDDDPSTIVEHNAKWEKVVILKHMFTLEELEEDPAVILDIKEDIREECSKIGDVTNVVLFDLEPEGVASVRFVTAEAARQCVNIMHGRNFGGQKIEAYVSEGRDHFRKSKKKEDEEEEETN